MYFVYVIKNEKHKIYIGQTNDLEKRLMRHNGLLASKPKSYTKINKGKWEIVNKEDYKTRYEALKREKYLKSHIGRDWLNNSRAGSSAVEQEPFKLLVTGSNPVRLTPHITPQCFYKS